MNNRTHEIKNANELEFAIFCIENVAAYIGAEPQHIHHLLTAESDILLHYIIPNYDVLHTQDKEYIVGDILDIMREKGLNV